MKNNPLAFLQLATLVAFYLLPTIIAFRRANNEKVIMINILLGWTRFRVGYRFENGFRVAKGKS